MRAGFSTGLKWSAFLTSSLGVFDWVLRGLKCLLWPQQVAQQ